MQSNVSRILGISGSYWGSCALHAAIKLDLFTRIGDKKIEADRLAKDSGLHPRGLKELLNALSAIGLLTKKKNRYENPPPSKALLVKSSPDYLGHIILHHHHLMAQWSNLDKSVRTGKPVRKGRRNEQETKSFLLGMSNMAMQIAPQVAKSLDLTGRKHLLDFGGGPGTYAIHFCMSNPDLKATVYDLPSTRPFAEDSISRFGLSERIQFKAGDYLKDAVDLTCDAAWLSQILHSHGPTTCQLVVDKAASTLEPGGLFFIHEFMMDESFDGPAFPALFSLNMLVNTAEGRTYSDSQLIAMLKKAGLHDIQHLTFKGPNDSGIIRGVR